MARPGPTPKDPVQRARRNKDPIPTTKVRRRRGKPVLPDPPPWLREWPPQTLVWWTHWVECEWASTFSVEDWDYLADTALLHAGAWGEGNLNNLTEIRLRLVKFGATIEDRQRLRIQLEDDTSASPSPASTPVSTLDERRQRLANVS